MKTYPVYINAVIALLIAGSVLAVPVHPPPAGVSPGDPIRWVGVQSRCPSFDWVVVQDAVDYEIRVYSAGVGDSTPGDEPVLVGRVPAGATGWTPSAEQCLSPGKRYAWSLRAATRDGTSEWSTPLFFRIAEIPSADELARALEIVRRHLDLPEPADLSERSLTEDGSPATDLPGVDTLEPRPAAIAAGSVAAKVEVDGEVRTVAPDGGARVWGTGRSTQVYGTLEGFPTIEEVPCENGSIKYGLSEIWVDWGSAAEACPRGTWVCHFNDLPYPACDTTRPDGAEDHLDCAGVGVDRPGTSHQGCTLDSTANTSGRVREESSNNVLGQPTCATLPVWCCWE